MKYIGEHLLPGDLGRFFLVLSLVSSLLATIAYAIANKKNDFDQKQSWLRIARFSFLLETISVCSIFIILYYIISHHLFEYKYAWQHSDKSLQIEYLFSCFWEGQEGSFMLWSFWHCVLGWILIWKSKQWQAGVMTVISFAQFCLATMIVGIYFFGERVGSSPFVLLRNEMDAPIFSRPEYLSLVKDGNGLNTLLQNYWMVIHPPILFLGFASTIVPFAFAYAGLVNKNHDWVKVSIPWTVFSVAVLGTGIMMGAMWAYESLSFGGYWAWDPVENASLVPWLIMVAGLHVSLVYKSTGYSLRSSYFFYSLSFILILYSTFLTRSGVLGDTSVHAFTDLGMNVQLYLFLNVFVWFPTLFAARERNTKIIIIGSFILGNILSIYFPSFTLISVIASFVWFSILLNKHVPTITKEENTYSREFWMFIGSLVLFLSGVVITLITSLPVFNKIFAGWAFFKKAFSQPEDAEFTHNQIQIFVAIILGILTAVTQYFKYKDTPTSYFNKKIWLPTLIALSISLLIGFFGNIAYDKHGIGFLGAIHLAIFSALYAIVANTSYIWLVLKGNIKAAGASVAHIGFGMVLLGILISSGNKTILSWNKTGITTLQKTKQEDPAENTTLFKNIATDMGKYMVTYIGDTINARDRKRYFEIDFKPKDGSQGFKVYPDVIKSNKDKNFSANPDAKHYWNKDIFVYITSFKEDDKTDTTSFKPQEIKKGDTVFYSNGFMVLDSVSINPEDKRASFLDGEQAIFLQMSVTSKEGLRYKSMPGIVIKDSTIRFIPDTITAQNLVLKFNKVLDQKT
ncbi:MAG: cytochrome c biogenesis protein CcsA, partial [Chitinophagaceae bacterium]|nr:cytochrome c biogenesis protein CcsA [Chitinophagaceae bacterium]